jgi:membrane protease YdiL (CAAX protease family)
MSNSLAIPARPKDVLVKGAVRAWHVIFILLVAYVVAEIAANKLMLKFDASTRDWAFPILNGGISATICLAFVAVVPEFRRTLPILFARPLTRPQASDLSWAFLAMLCWGYGLYVAGFLAPLMQARPEWFAVVGFHELTSPIGWKYLAIAVQTVLLAPIAEELMYRGFLMNLWISRWGVWGGVITSSIVFGLFHRQNALFASVMGLAFALVYLKYDSLLPGIVLHGVYNLLVFDPLLGQVVWVKNRAEIQDLTQWIPEIIISVLFVPVAWMFWRRFKPAP